MNRTPTQAGPAGRGGAAVSLRSVTVRYPNAKAPAIADVCLDVEPGEFLTLLGPSGSGKTSTLNLIAGFLESESGSLLVDGRDVSPLPPYKRNFGMVFQNYALFPHMTVEQNVAFPLVERKVKRSEIRERVGQALELVDLLGLETRKPDQLSGGQQQRVALARAIVFSPRLLLLDEPLGALDRKLRASLQEQIRALHKELGLTFVFVTHDQEEAMALSDRIAVFNHGNVVRVGRAAELYDDPGTVFVARFLGESNLFRGNAGAGTYHWCGHTWTMDRDPGPDAPILMVRPERVGLIELDDTPPRGSNTAKVRVLDLVFLGVNKRVDLQFPDGSRGSAILPGDKHVPGPGSDAQAIWSVADQRALREDDDTHLGTEQL